MKTVSHMRDVFRPTQEPNQTIYDAFLAEASKRNGRPIDVWLQAERDAVLKAAQDAANNPSYKLASPSMEMVRSAENYAMGSIDYGRKWVSVLIRKMEVHSG